MKVLTANLKQFKLIVLLIVTTFGFTLSHTTSAEEIELPLERIVATESITKLEVISAVKTLLADTRILSIKKKSSYSNPDCHHVKALDGTGELQSIKLGCYIEKLVQKDHK